MPGPGWASGPAPIMPARMPYPGAGGARAFASSGSTGDRQLCATDSAPVIVQGLVSGQKGSCATMRAVAHRRVVTMCSNRCVAGQLPQRARCAGPVTAPLPGEAMDRAASPQPVVVIMGIWRF